jgi:trans-feruloyl-CoA hydratase/vanillin synthase
VNWGIIPGGIVSWNLVDMILPRHALYYAVTGEPFDGKRAVELGLVNFSVPLDRLRERTLQLARHMLRLNPGVVRATKEAMRAVRGMSVPQARDYLRGKQDTLVRTDQEIRDQVGMKEFLDNKSYRPGIGPYAPDDK